MRKHVIGGEGAVGAKYHAERLMRTELARVQTEAQKQSIEENGFELYQFFVNGGCCSACEEVAKKKTKYGTGVYRIKDLQPGLNAAPIHPNCRCSIAPYEDSDEYEAWLDFLDKGGTTKEWERLKNDTLNKKNRLKSDIGTPGFITPENIEDFKDIGIDEYIAKEIGKLPENHLDYLNGYIERFIIDDKLNSRFDRERKILYLRSDPIEGELIHELGHVLETKSGLIYTDKYREIRENGMGQISIFRIRRGKKYEYVENEKFVSRYQGMLYEQDNNGYKSRKRDGYINLECLGEYFSEGYREYFINPENLKRKDPELFEYIRILKLK